MKLRFLLNKARQSLVVQSKLHPNICLEYQSLRFCSLDHNETQLGSDQNLNEEKFRVMELVQKKLARKKRVIKNLVYMKQPREKAMPVTQDWGNVWPGPRTFHPASVPLPVRMGYPKKFYTYPDKWANAELMKIPNFLHLTPPVIKRQCEAIKKFCTSWPKELESKEAQKYFYPVVVTKSSFCQSSTTIRDPRARDVTFTVPLESLELDWHAKDKFLRLVGDKFDPKTGLLTLIADRCPLSSQNLDYCEYLLTVIYNESLKTEPWEHEKHELDHEHFTFERSGSKAAIEFLSEATKEPIPEEDIKKYSKAVTVIHNEAENEKSVDDYRNAVLKVLKLN